MTKNAIKLSVYPSNASIMSLEYSGIFTEHVVSLLGPFHTTGLSGPQHTFEMDARDDFIEDGECHSNNSQEPEEQDSTSGELHGFRGNSRLRVRL